MERLGSWARERGHSTAKGRIGDVADIDLLWVQWQLLAGRLEEAAAEVQYRSAWKGASGTAVMRHVFTERRFYADCAEFLYVFQLMATKTRNEAVVEGMGSVWDKVNDPQRHPGFTTGAEEAVIAYSAPPCASAEAEDFLRRALAKHFKTAAWGKKFVHTDEARGTNTFGVSKVIQKTRDRAKSRLPARLYRM